MGDTQAEATFHRPPRSWPDTVPSEELRIHAPPTKPEPPSGGVMQMLFPVVGSFSMLGFALVYRNKLFMYIAFGLVCMMLLFAVAMRWSQVRGVRKRRQRNRHKYRMYLTGVERRAVERRGSAALRRRAALSRSRAPVGPRPRQAPPLGAACPRRRLPAASALGRGRGAARPRGAAGHRRRPAGRARARTSSARRARSSARWERVNDLPVVIDLTGVARRVHRRRPPPRRTVAGALAAARSSPPSARPSDLRMSPPTTPPTPATGSG